MKNPWEILTYSNAYSILICTSFTCRRDKVRQWLMIFRFEQSIFYIKCYWWKTKEDIWLFSASAKAFSLLNVENVFIMCLYKFEGSPSFGDQFIRNMLKSNNWITNIYSQKHINLH